MSATPSRRGSWRTSSCGKESSSSRTNAVSARKPVVGGHLGRIPRGNAGFLSLTRHVATDAGLGRLLCVFHDVDAARLADPVLDVRQAWRRDQADGVDNPPVQLLRVSGPQLAEGA